MSSGRGSPTLVVMRHGQTDWNRQGRLTGWVDEDINGSGVDQATAAGAALAAAGISFDIAFASVLLRALHTAELVLERVGPPIPDVRADWRLNERHYGVLEGLDRDTALARFGRQARLWRRDVDARPPSAPANGPHPNRTGHPDNMPRPPFPKSLPKPESLGDVIIRVMEAWHHSIAPELAGGRNVLVVAHTNPIRALVHHLEGVALEDVAEMVVPPATPVVYRFEGEPPLAVSRAVLTERMTVQADLEE